MLKPKIKILLFIIFISFIILPVIVQAELLPDCALGTQDGSKGNELCQLCDIVQTGVLIFRWILGIVGSSALVMFVWHGLQMIISSGNKEKVTAAKKGMVHTIIGLVIVLFSWFIINFIIVVSTSKTSDIKAGTLFSQQWYECDPNRR